MNEVTDGDDVQQECVDGCEPNRDSDSDGITDTTIEIATLE